jgi:hypothetical protein
VNALRDIKSANEIEVRLQTNEVLVHLPTDTQLGAVPEAIYEAGYKPDKSVWLSASGHWTAEGFTPQGWTSVLPGSAPAGAKDGIWEIHFQQQDAEWVFESARSTESVPQIQDIDAR